MHDVCIVGHVTLDRLVRDDLVTIQPGGAAHYAGMTALRLGLSAAVITRVHAGDSWLLDELREAGAAVRQLPSRATTAFENRPGRDLESRSLSITSLGDPFSPADLREARSRAIHLGPLSGDEMSRGVILEAAERAPLALLDVQGLVRPSRPGPVVLEPWNAMRDVLPHIAIVKADLAEAMHLTGEPNAERAARALARIGVREVLVTMGAKGSIVAGGETLESVPALAPRRSVDSTGAGDCFAAGYLAARLRGRDPVPSARFASAVAVLKLEVQGPFAAPLEEAQALSGVAL